MTSNKQMTDDVDRAQKVARYYRQIGLAPLPSKNDEKRPDLFEFASLQSEPLSEERMSCWRTKNIQLMCGARTYGRRKVIVIDLDGYQAEIVWEEMVRVKGGHEKTWEVRTGSGGRHVYFEIKGANLAPFKSGLIWGIWDTWGENGRGGWQHHKAIQVLGDGLLAVAPPSIHVVTGKRYGFIDGHCPKTILFPAPVPGWLTEMPRLGTPRFAHEERKPILQAKKRIAGCSRLNRSEVLAMIDDKAALAESWGLRIASRKPNMNGWMSCHAVGREDRTPSASFSADNGTYHDCRDAESVSLFDLGVMLGQFATWQDAMRWCESAYTTSNNGAT